MFEERCTYINVAAGQDLTPAAVLHKALTVNGTIAANGRDAVGVLKSHGPQGLGVRVADSGIIKIVAGAAVSTPGFPITVTTSGFCIASPVGSATIGKAFTAAASGDLMAILADFSNVGVS